MIRILLLFGIIETATGANFISFKPVPVDAPPPCSHILDGSDPGSSLPIPTLTNGKDLRVAILSRRRYKGDLYFHVPEFRPILETALKQMDELERRIESLSRLKFRWIRRNVTTPLKISLFRSRVLQMLNQNLIPYWEAIELVTQFNQVAQSIELLEGGMHWLARDVRRVGQVMASLKEMAKLYPIVILPVFQNLSRQDINLIWSAGILPLGATMKVEEVDNTFYGPVAFGRHDAEHALGFICSLKRAVSGSPSDYDTVTDAEWEKMNALLTESYAVMGEFWSQFERVSDKGLRKDITDAYFNVDHEGVGFVSHMSQSADPVIESNGRPGDWLTARGLASAWINENWNLAKQRLRGRFQGELNVTE